jgi:predicted dehydrogenase
MEPVKALLLGAGSRGRFAFGQYAKMNPAMLQIAALAEPDPSKRKIMQEEHNIPSQYVYADWEEAFKNFPPVSAVIIAMQDNMHFAPILKAIKQDVHIICEKPIVPTLDECHTIEKSASNFNKVIMIAHVLKYTLFFSSIKELLSGGRIGKLTGIDLIENVGHIHISHSFVRGNWRKTPESAPMILAKSCHDMDMLAWLADSPCESLSSYGKLNYFKPENAPTGAPDRCLDGCPAIDSCPYHVEKIYLGTYTDWPVNVISNDLSIEGRIKALKEGPYGRCVFHCDNNVVDHQAVLLNFANGVTANFTMSGFTMKTHRSIKLFGTTGEISGDMEGNTIVVKDFVSGNTETIAVAKAVGGHAGGDPGFITDFVRMIHGSGGEGRNTLKKSFESHYMAFAAERSRLEGGRMIKLSEIRST